MCIFFCKVQSDTEIIVFSFVKKEAFVFTKSAAIFGHHHIYKYPECNSALTRD